MLFTWTNDSDSQNRLLHLPLTAKKNKKQQHAQVKKKKQKQPNNLLLSALMLLKQNVKYSKTTQPFKDSVKTHNLIITE